MHQRFWIEQPALLFGLSLLIGSSSFLFWASPWNWVWPLLWVGYLAWLRKWAVMLLVAGGAVYGWGLYSSAPSGNCGYFSIASVQPHQSPFHKALMYRGTLYVDGKKIPCCVPYLGKDHPKANCDYVLKGKLQERGFPNYLFKAQEWIPVKKTGNLAEFRYQMKEQLRHFLEKKLQRPRTASFLGALITGDVEDRALRFEFGRLGLQHILAISGFHFAILIGFCSFFLSLFLPHRAKIIVLLLAINAYFLFVGSLPAVQRSWLTVLLYLIGKLIGRHSSGLNLLGFALLIEVLLDPLISANLGFQFSFVSCAGILLFTPLFEPAVLYFLPKHRPSELTPFAQHAYLIASFLRKCLSVSLAVNIAILPLILYHFHKFPLLSLFYNLFFPLLVSGVLFALLVSLFLYVVFPPLAHFAFIFTDFLTAQLLDLAAYPPPALDYSLRVSSWPAWVIPLYLFAPFCLSLNLKTLETQRS